MRIRRSPFPGMDPYLEQRWDDVHTRLCTLISSTIQPLLPGPLRARAERRVMLETTDEDDVLLRSYRADAAVIETPDSHRASAFAMGNQGGTALIPEPLQIRILRERPVDRWVQIIDVSNGNRVITAIEVLSPTNKKSGKANEKYREKLDEYLNAGVNVVELDLLRSSRDHLIISPEYLETSLRTDYLACINRDGKATWFVYPLSLREPLPTIPIPCRPTDTDVPLTLQPLIDQIYIDGGHDDIDYAKPLDAPLSIDDAKWVETLIANRPVLQ